MEAIKVKNQSRTERHQRAAEDEEAFKEAEQARKAIDTQTRVQTRKKKSEIDKRRKELEYVVLLSPTILCVMRFISVNLSNVS